MRLTGPGSWPPSPAPLQFCLRENSTSAKRGDRNLIDRAAKTRGKNRTGFILDAARMAAIINHQGPPIPARVLAKKGSYRVIAGPFESNRKAREVAKRLKIDLEIDGMLIELGDSE